MGSLLPFDWHPLVLTVILGVGLAHHLLVSSPRQRRLAQYALLALLVVTMWPIGDLAASVSLCVATAQRLVIMLLVAPLLLLSIPTAALGRMTRPAPIDFIVRKLAHPGVAFVVVTFVGTATLATPVVDWGARSTYGRDLILLAVLVVGFVLWIPALAIMPGTRRLSPAARAGYVFASALFVTSLSFVWIFSQHPLYPALHDQVGAVAHQASLRPTARRLRGEARLLHPDVGGRLSDLLRSRRARARRSKRRRCTGLTSSVNCCASTASGRERSTHHRPDIATALVEWKSRGDVAQLVERGLCKPEVVGSIPIVSTVWSLPHPDA